MMQSLDLNFSGYQIKKGEEAIDELRNVQIPDLKVYNAEQCYKDAKKLTVSTLLDLKQMKSLIKQSSAENQITSHYTSPLYLANLMLRQKEDGHAKRRRMSQPSRFWNRRMSWTILRLISKRTKMMTTTPTLLKTQQSLLS